MSLNTSLVFLLILTASIFLSLDKTAAQHDKCNNNKCCSQGGGGGYKEINDARRSVKNHFKAGQNAICDIALPWGWYRFTSYVGGKMPIQMVPRMRCGTVHPVWMNGSLPTRTDGVVDHKACINFFGIGCFVSLRIKVKFCVGSPDFFVYYLGPTYSCSLAYCAGFRKPCPPGQTGNPCKPVKITPPRIFDSNNLGTPSIQVISGEQAVAVSLLCKVDLLQGIEQRDDVEYKIEWTSEGKTLRIKSRCDQKDRIPCPNTNSIVSTLIGFTDYLAGIWVSCRVSAKYKDPGSKWSTPKDVKKPFFAGIEVSPTTLRIDLNACSKQKGNKITIRPTIPARLDPVTNSYSRARFILPEKGLKLRIKDRSTNQNCLSTEFKLQGTDPVHVEVVPDCTALEKDTKSTKVIVVKMMPNNKFWQKTFVRTIWVSIIMTHVEQCKTYTDPHYHAMEKLGTTRRFDFMGHGDFVLYRNQEKNFEVHTRQWACNRRGVTCNCGAVLRDHNDVIEFNCCNKDLMFQNTHPTPLQVKLRSKKCLRPGIHLAKKFNGGNNDYTVIFPTGAQVDIVRNYWGIDVTIITQRAKSRNDESGICLYEKGSIQSYGEQQRLQPGTSYFDTLPPNIDDTTADYAPLCSGQASFYVPTFIKRSKTTFTLCDLIKKREVYYSDELTAEDYELFKKLPPSENRHRFGRALPATVIPLKNATNYCVERIANSKVGKICANQGVDVQSFVDSCSLDISLTGDHSFAMGIVSMLTNECGYVTAINASSANSNESSDGRERVGSLQKEISELLCPNDCAFNGDCVNGSCVCYQDYTAEDCSISLYQKPSISKLQRDGLCDRRIRPCKKVTVMGTGWLNSTNLTCHLIEFKVVNSSWNPKTRELRFPGIMVDLLLVDCFLPDSPIKQGFFDENIGGTPAAGLKVSVSNDGVHKSNQNLTLISYDSACMACNVSNGCYLKDNSCFINNYCFAPNEVHPGDWCFQCLPDVHKNTWTKRQVNHPPNITSRKDYYALYGENLDLVFDVVDPEGMPVIISLLGGGPKDAMLRDNILHWNVTSDRITIFHLLATDICSASTTFNITISLVNCQCQNNGSCSPVAPRGSGFYLCECPPGFTGAKCETNIDECQTYPCVQGLCTDGINNYSCRCDPGYAGRHCDQNQDECASSPCVNGSCTDLVNGYICNCHPGYVGTHCDENVDECLSYPCFYGTCFDQINDYKCLCKAGYTGKDCDVNIDECQSSPCINGNCTDQVNGFSCRCQTGFSGARCEYNIDDCLPVSCGNGTCIDLLNNYSCICKVGYTGEHCEIPITRCNRDSCYPGVQCTEISHSISCGPCPTGFTGDGKNCRDIDDCHNHTCQNGASCVDGVNDYSCTCVIGFTGSSCKIDINDCVNHTCANSGTCEDGTNSYLCKCVAGFSGNHCQNNIDDCHNHTCQNGASCVDGFNDYSCACAQGFTGQSCETNIDDCRNHTCQNGASCVDGVNGYSCTCVVGFSGSRCKIDIDNCVNHKCGNGGTCVDGINSYSCRCVAGFTGNHCQNNIDDCHNHTCQNGASCVDGVNDYSCACMAGFTGSRCETAISSVNEQSSRKTSPGPSESKATSSKTSAPVIATTTRGFETSFISVRISQTINPSSPSREVRITSSIRLPNALSSQTAFTTPKTDAPRTDKPATEKITTGAFETEEPETEEAAIEESKTELIMELHVDMTWNDELNDKSSAAFKGLSREFEKEIQQQYSKDDNFVAVRILSFRKGSVVVEFKLKFKGKLKTEEALAPLKEGIKDGRMGSLRVDPESLRVKNGREETTKPKISLAMGIGITCGGVFFSCSHFNLPCSLLQATQW